MPITIIALFHAFLFQIVRQNSIMKRRTNTEITNIDVYSSG